MEDSLVTTLLLPAALAVIMLSLGLELTTADFRRVLTAPRAVASRLRWRSPSATSTRERSSATCRWAGSSCGCC